MSPDVIDGCWSPGEVEAFLDAYVGPLRLAVSTPSGFPLICSLWYAVEDGRLQCATTRYAKIAELLRRDARCGFEIAPNEPPYYGVRGQGEATLTDEGAMPLLGRLVDRYLGSRETDFAKWLLDRERDEIRIAIDVRWLTSWDYRARMQTGRPSKDGAPR
jgi:hypothetical protein